MATDDELFVIGWDATEENTWDPSAERRALYEAGYKAGYDKGWDDAVTWSRGGTVVDRGDG